VSGILDMIDNPRTRQLYLLRTSSRFVERVAASVQMHLDTAKRLSQALESQDDKRRIAVTAVSPSSVIHLICFRYKLLRRAELR